MPIALDTGPLMGSADKSPSLFCNGVTSNVRGKRCQCSFDRWNDPDQILLMESSLELATEARLVVGGALLQAVQGLAALGRPQAVEDLRPAVLDHAQDALQVLGSQRSHRLHLQNRVIVFITVLASQRLDSYSKLLVPQQ